MKSAWLMIAVVLLATASVGEERDRVNNVPQPRPRLDPATQGAGASPTVGDRRSTSAPATMMAAYVVRQTAAVPNEPRSEPEREGPFTPLRGGEIYAVKAGRARVELGLWPWFDVFAKDAQFKSPKTRVDVDFLRVRW
jgi:hypothetical protein